MQQCTPNPVMSPESPDPGNPKGNLRMPSMLRPSAMSLLITMKFNDQTLATGTGFTVVGKNGPLLITNRHNLTGRRQDTDEPLSRTGGIPNEVQIVHNRSGRLGSWVIRTERLYEEEEPRWIEHPALGAKVDVVGLPLTDLEGIELYPYDLDALGPDILLAPGEVVSVIGFPFGMQAGGSLAVWATGFIASEPIVHYGGLPVFLIDCRSRPGQSGAAVIAHRGGGAVAMREGRMSVFNGPVYRLLGIYSGRVHPDSDLGMVWKVSLIQEIALGYRTSVPDLV